MLMRYGLQGQLGAIKLKLFRSGPEQAKGFDLAVFSDFKNTFFLHFKFKFCYYPNSHMGTVSSHAESQWTMNAQSVYTDSYNKQFS